MGSLRSIFGCAAGEDAMDEHAQGSVLSIAAATANSTNAPQQLKSTANIEKYCKKISPSACAISHTNSFISRTKFEGMIAEQLWALFSVHFVKVLLLQNYMQPSLRCYASEKTFGTEIYIGEDDDDNDVDFTVCTVAANESFNRILVDVSGGSKLYDCNKWIADNIDGLLDTKFRIIDKFHVCQREIVGDMRNYVMAAFTLESDEKKLRASAVNITVNIRQKMAQNMLRYMRRYAIDTCKFNDYVSSMMTDFVIDYMAKIFWCDVSRSKTDDGTISYVLRAKQNVINGRRRATRTQSDTGLIPAEMEKTIQLLADSCRPYEMEFVAEMCVQPAYGAEHWQAIFHNLNGVKKSSPYKQVVNMLKLRTSEAMLWYFDELGKDALIIDRIDENN